VEVAAGVLIPLIVNVGRLEGGLEATSLGGRVDRGHRRWKAGATTAAAFIE
jgi:hypothetical protein